MYQVHNVSEKKLLKTFKRVIGKRLVREVSFNGTVTKEGYSKRGTLEKIKDEYGTDNIYIFSTTTKNWYHIDYSSITKDYVLTFHHTQK